jgi:hypothetical protein
MKKTVGDKLLEDALRAWFAYNPTDPRKLRLTKKLRAAIAEWVSANLVGGALDD